MNITPFVKSQTNKTSPLHDIDNKISFHFHLLLTSEPHIVTSNTIKQLTNTNNVIQKIFQSSAISNQAIINLK